MVGRSERRKAILDLGGFLGASAACIAAGVRSVGGASVVHSYDLFVYGPWCVGHDLGPGWSNGDDLRPWVEAALGPDSGVILVKDDICRQHWRGGKVDSLFVDFTQNWDHHNHVCAEFLPALRVGGILAHQDYVHTLCYWLHIFMERNEQFFEPLSRHIKNSTAAWVLREELPATAREPLHHALRVSEMEALLDRSLERYTGIGRGLLEIARIRFFMHTRGPEAARAALRRVQDRILRHPPCRPHLEVLRDEIAAWPTRGGPYEGYFRER